jgi:hypothetical protein
MAQGDAKKPEGRALPHNISSKLGKIFATPEKIRILQRKLNRKVAK